jgi:predicted metal-binding protein
VSSAETTIFVCTACRASDNPDHRPGEFLLKALEKSAAARADLPFRIEAVECLAVCKRPCTIALAGAGKWTYVIGDLDSEQHVADILAAAESYAASENGIVPWKERPGCFRKGVVSRIPPLGAGGESGKSPS